MNGYNAKTRYGWDNLSKFLAVISLPFLFSRSSVLLVIGLILLGWSIVRVLSKNMSRRRREEIVFENWSRHANYWLDVVVEKFNSLGANIREWYMRQKWKAEERKRFKVIKCPNCSQKLRVPRRKGKLLITCSSCGHKFNKRT